jgi:NADPH:quinone reductase-like Zn-dependent oxidoreductase
MKALVLAHRDGPDGLKLCELPDPARPPGWVEVAVRRACLNRVDVYMRRSGAGITHRLPMILGLDAAGEVVAADPQSAFVPGTRVVVYPALFCGQCAFCLRGDHPLCDRVRYFGEHRDGVFAERIVVPQANLVALPPDADLQQAAALPTAYLTAYRMLYGKVPLRAEETVLIHGIGGGVSLAALQLAGLVGARTIVTSRRADARDRALLLGASHALDSADPELWRKVLALTDGRGVDMVIETVGAATWGQSLRSLRKGGRLIVCGATTGGAPPADLQRLFIRQLSVHGSTLGSLSEFRSLIELWLSGRFRPLVTKVFAFDDAVSALDALERGEQFGKIGLAIAG